ncbi:hypothetical protein [Pararhizobium gei]|uniref:hypothetical protein n=1 Tax=Pararhizobium gei TaxID=1395951 RepID=UPI0023DC4008|nr:hypothetical protein [Rhizobium gei]
MRRHVKKAPAPPSSQPNVGLPMKKNAWQPQIIPPYRVDLPLARTTSEQIAVPASINGRSMVSGRL